MTERIRPRVASSRETRAPREYPATWKSPIPSWSISRSIRTPTPSLGELVILASGPQHVRDILTPVFGALGRATAWLGPAGHGTRAKLVLNNWLADLTETTAETLSFARRLDLDPAEIVDLLQSTPLGAPYAVQKARSMLAGDFSPAFALKLALKDAELATQAAQDSGATLTLTSALLPRWRDTAASGHADDDLSAVYLTT
jgi:3-hydroxyisobutyrate dehydrogenase